MKLKELKCINCGASLDIPEGSKKVTCQFCNTSFAVEDAYSDAYDNAKGVFDAQIDTFNQLTNNMFGRRFGKRFLMLPSIIFIVVAAVMIGSISFLSFNESKKFDVTSFNLGLVLHEGTNFGSNVKNVLEDIVTINKTNKDHKITVVYEDVSTFDTNEITKIKKELDDFTEYELSFDYDKKGYAYKLVISK